MPKLEILTPKGEDGQPTSTWDTIVKVDGRELPFVRSLSVHFRVDDVVTADVALFVTDGFAYEADAAVNVSLEVAQGCVLVEEIRPDGTRVYRAEAEKVGQC